MFSYYASLVPLFLVGLGLSLFFPVLTGAAFVVAAVILHIYAKDAGSAGLALLPLFGGTYLVIYTSIIVMILRFLESTNL